MVNNEEIKTVRTITFDNRRKEMTTTHTVESMKLPSGEVGKDFGHNKSVQVLTEKGIKVLVKDLNAQKINYQRQHKEMEKQISALGDLKVDEEFLAKLRAAKEMDSLQQLQDSKKNAESTIKEINKQLSDVKGAVKNYIKF